jgi:hypothetical protein
MTIASILTSGMPLLIELLAALPDTSDPVTWPRIVLSDPPHLLAVPQVLSALPVLLTTIEISFVPKLYEPVTVVGFGARFQGSAVCVGPVSPFYLVSGFPCVFRASIAVYPWAA